MGDGGRNIKDMKVTDYQPLKLAEEVPSFLIPVAGISKIGVLFVLISRHRRNNEIKRFYPDIHFDSLKMLILIHFFIDFIAQLLLPIC